MTTKRIVTALLLMFIFGSVAYMAAKEVLLADTGAGMVSGGEERRLGGDHPSVVVYFFDSEKECTTCENLERYAYETLQTHFASLLASGEIEWRVRNIQEPEHEHFVTKFGLYTKSVVVVRLENGEPVRWKNLESIWDLVYDKPSYVEYIRANVQEFIGDGS